MAYRPNRAVIDQHGVGRRSFPITTFHGSSPRLAGIGGHYYACGTNQDGSTMWCWSPGYDPPGPGASLPLEAGGGFPEPMLPRPGRLARSGAPRGRAAPPKPGTWAARFNR